MNAFVYGLNDTDERVRREAAEGAPTHVEIGERIERLDSEPTAADAGVAEVDRGVRRSGHEARRHGGRRILAGGPALCEQSGQADAKAARLEANSSAWVSSKIANASHPAAA